MSKSGDFVITRGILPADNRGFEEWNKEEESLCEERTDCHTSLRTGSQ